MNSPCWVRLLKISALLQNLTQKFKKLAQGRIFLYERKKRPLVLHALQSIRFLFPTYAENKRILLRTNFQNYRNVFGWRRVVFKCRFNAESEGWQGRFLFRVLIIICFPQWSKHSTKRNISCYVRMLKVYAFCWVRMSKIIAFSEDKKNNWPRPTLCAILK
jgi:hypothetical protein